MALTSASEEMMKEWLHDGTVAIKAPEPAGRAVQFLIFPLNSMSLCLYEIEITVLPTSYHGQGN
jgi:hypothetical protein